MWNEYSIDVYLGFKDLWVATSASWYKMLPLPLSFNLQLVNTHNSTNASLSNTPGCSRGPPICTLKMGGLAEASTTPAPSLPSLLSLPSLPSLIAPDPGVPGHSGDVHHPSAPESDASDSNGTTSSKVPDTPEAQAATMKTPGRTLAEVVEDGKCQFSNTARGTQVRESKNLCHITSY